MSQLSQHIIGVPSSGRSQSGQMYNSGPLRLIPGLMLRPLFRLTLVFKAASRASETVLFGILRTGGGEGVCATFGNLIEGTFLGIEEVTNLRKKIDQNIIIIYAVKTTSHLAMH